MDLWHGRNESHIYTRLGQVKVWSMWMIRAPAAVGTHRYRVWGWGPRRWWTGLPQCGSRCSRWSWCRHSAERSPCHTGRCTRSQTGRAPDTRGASLVSGPGESGMPSLRTNTETSWTDHLRDQVIEGWDHGGVYIGWTGRAPLWGSQSC